MQEKYDKYFQLFDIQESNQFEYQYYIHNEHYNKVDLLFLQFHMEFSLLYDESAGYLRLI